LKDRLLSGPKWRGSQAQAITDPVRATLGLTGTIEAAREYLLRDARDGERTSTTAISTSFQSFDGVSFERVFKNRNLGRNFK
jgi:hypothetical protein